MLRAISYVAGFGVAIPVLLGGIRLIHRPLVQRTAWVWMAYALGTNFWMYVMAQRREPNNLISEFSVGLAALLGTHVMGELVESRRARGWIYVALGAFFAFWIWRAAEGDYLNHFSLYTLPAAFLLFTIAGTVLVMERIRRTNAPAMRDFGMLIGFGAVISYAPAAALTTLSSLFYETHTDAVLFLWSLRGVFLVFGLVFFSLAFLWTIPPRSSSGSSASAA